MKKKKAKEGGVGSKITLGFMCEHSRSSHCKLLASNFCTVSFPFPATFLATLLDLTPYMHALFLAWFFVCLYSLMNV